MKRVGNALILASFFFSFSCVQRTPVGPAEAFIHVETIFRSTRCQTQSPAPRALWIDSDTELKQWWESIHRQRLGGTSASVPHVDFNADGLLLVHMGRQPTGGYALELAAPRCPVKKEIAAVVVNWRHPAPGAAVTQAITAPCLLLKVPRGTFRAIQIIDQHGRVRATAEMPKKAS